MFYKVLYLIVSAITCLITYYIANALAVSGRLINTWREAADKNDFSEILKWNDKYNSTPVKTISNDNVDVYIYEIVNYGTETNNSVENQVVSTGYEFIMKAKNKDNVKYADKETTNTDASINFYYPGKVKDENGNEVDGYVKVEVGYYSYEFENIHAVSQLVSITDTSVNLSVNEQFKKDYNLDVTNNYYKVEITDAEGKIIAELNDLSSSIDTTNVNEWVTGYSDDEKDSFMKPDNYIKVIGPILIVVAIFALGFFLLFFRKKKDRLFLSDSSKQTKNTKSIKASNINVDNVTDIIDEDKIEADDVDENSML